MILTSTLPFLSPRVASILSLLILTWSATPAQFKSLGLEGRAVYSLRSYGGKLYAGTDDGAYVWLPSMSDTTWKSIGLKGKRVRAIYPHSYGPLSYAVTAGIGHSFGDPDSILTFCTFGNDTAWAPTDTGMDRSAVRSIRSVDGFPSQAVCGETYAAGGEKVYVRGLLMWEQVFQLGGVVNVVRTHSPNSASPTVWAGGETNIFWPYIAHSHDKGKTWTTTYPYLAGDNACNSLAFDPTDTLTVYAGMEGAVVKSTDGGHSWDTTGLTRTPFYFYGLTYDAFMQTLFAAGASNSAQTPFGLYRSSDAGKSWSAITSPDSIAGALCLETMPTAIPEVNWLLIGTNGTGVRLFMIGPASVEEDAHAQETRLEQNYPNPFNPTTAISYQLSAVGHVKLNVYDVLGREVEVLVDAIVEPGKHTASWEAHDLSSGVYFCQLRVAPIGPSRGHSPFVGTRKLLLLR